MLRRPRLKTESSEYRVGLRSSVLDREFRSIADRPPSERRLREACANLLDLSPKSKSGPDAKPWPYAWLDWEIASDGTRTVFEVAWIDHWPSVGQPHLRSAPQGRPGSVSEYRATVAQRETLSFATTSLEALRRAVLHEEESNADSACTTDPSKAAHRFRSISHPVWPDTAVARRGLPRPSASLATRGLRRVCEQRPASSHLVAGSAGCSCVREICPKHLG